MDMNAILNAAGQQLWLSLPAFLFIITIIIVVHELGHFLAARLFGVTVSAFSMGFGPEIAHYVDRKGTRWRLAWVPLGGYVKFVDDDNASSVPTSAEVAAAERASASEEARKGFYHLKPVWQRAIIAAAGPVANFLLAIVVFAGFYMFVGEVDRPVRIDEVSQGMPAEAAGLKAGDIILSVNGTALPNFERLSLIINTSADRELELLVDRGGQQMTFKVTPKLQEEADILGGKARVGKIGIKQKELVGDPSLLKIRYYGPVEAVAHATSQVALIIEAGLRGIWDIIVTRQSVSALAGPTKMFEAAGKVASFGIEPLIRFLAIVSIAIGMTNLLPIPVLDGGHLVFYAIEAVLGRPLSQRTQEVAFRVGLAVVLMLLVITTVNHLTGVVGRMLS
jgi:regulator of sigma E protease